VISVRSINPSSGSIHGGTLVTLTGNGFSSNNVVKFDSSTCSILSVSFNELKCLTSAHAAQNAPLSIEYLD
jgi:hypothetical protein